MNNTEQATLYLSLDTYSSKPKGKVIGSIQNSILRNKVNIEPKQLAQEVAVNGRACKLCNLPEGAKNLKDTPIINQRVLMVDIDNENTELPIFTIEDALKDEFVAQNAAFLYETFSSTLEKPKFRMVFILKNPATQNKQVEGLYDSLINRFPQSDSKCRETTRLFFGSNKGYVVVDWNNLLEDKKIFSEYHHREERETILKDSHIHLQDTYSIPKNIHLVYNLLYTKDMENVKKEIQNKELPYFGRTFTTLEEFKQFILKDTSVSMAELLDLPQTNPFRDIFHDENEPSVGVYRTEKGKRKNIELYKCFSDSHPFVGNILQVIGRLLNVDDFESILILKELLGIQITNEKEYLHISKTKESVNDFLLMLKKGVLNKKYPYLAKVLKNYNHSIYFILKEFSKGNIYFNPIKNKYEIYNNLSVRKLSKVLKDGDFGHTLSDSKMYTSLKILTLLDIITKKTDSELPNWLEEQVNSYRIKNKQEYRVEVYSLQPLTNYRLSKMEDLCMKLKEDNVSISKLDYDYIAITFNKKIADRTFITNTDEKRTVSLKNQYIEQEAVKLILKNLKDDIYIDEYFITKALYFKIKDNKKVNTMSKLSINNILVKCRKSICDKYGLKRVSLTKEKQIEYNITDIPKGKRPTVYMWDND